LPERLNLVDRRAQILYGWVVPPGAGPVVKTASAAGKYDQRSKTKMVRNLKVLGLAVMAVLAMTAISASAAQAQSFTSASETTWLTGEQEEINLFEITGGEVECEVAKFKGGPYAGKKLASVTVHPEYSGCLAFGRNATVDTGGCNYILYAIGTADIECEAGKSIVITVPSGPCNVTVGPQTGLSSIGYTNVAGGDVLVEANVGGIVYTSTGGACGPSGNNGTYTGTVLAQGFSNSTHTTGTNIEVD
jgi:hypothetical protein